MLKGLTKSQTLKTIYTDLLEEEDSRLWEYFASVIIKHTLLVCNQEEQKKFSLLLKNENEPEIEKFIETKIPAILPAVTQEIKEFRQKVYQKIIAHDPTKHDRN